MSEPLTADVEQAAASHGAPPRTTEDARVLLQARGCAVCAERDRSQAAFFDWFRLESYAEPVMLARLRASLGMCPPHTRVLLADPQAPVILQSVFAQVVPAAVDALAGPGTPDACPGCERGASSEEFALRTILRALGESRVARGLEESGGFCVPHTLAGLARGRWETVLAQTVARRLSSATGSTLLRAVAGSDPDAGARAVYRSRLPAPEPGRSTLARLRLRLARQTCPLCLAVGRMEQRYLEWLAEQLPGHDRSLVSDVESLCASHLHDVAALGDEVRDSAVGIQQRRWQGELGRHADRLPRRRRGLLDALRPARHRASSDLGPLLVRRCVLCSLIRRAEEQEARLLQAALADAAVERRYRRSHGLCLSHHRSVGRWAERAVLHDVLSARLSVLAWELDEAERKERWDARHEICGPESGAWRRAPAALDGRVYLGVPADEPA
jgi:hypothetical protein